MAHTSTLEFVSPASGLCSQLNIKYQRRRESYCCCFSIRVGHTISIFDAYLIDHCSFSRYLKEPMPFLWVLNTGICVEISMFSDSFLPAIFRHLIRWTLYIQTIFLARLLPPLNGCQVLAAKKLTLWLARQSFSTTRRATSRKSKAWLLMMRRLSLHYSIS